MNKSVSIFLVGLCAGAAVVLALSPTMRREAIDALDCAEEGSLNHVATQKKAIVNSIAAAKTTYNATIKSAGLQTAPMETN